MSIDSERAVFSLNDFEKQAIVSQLSDFDITFLSSGDKEPATIINAVKIVEGKSVELQIRPYYWGKNGEFIRKSVPKMCSEITNYFINQDKNALIKDFE